MFYKTKQLVLAGIVAFACCLFTPTNTLQACPMCKTATEDAGSPNEPQAYMMSIFAMLSMPVVLFSVLGVSLYRISSTEQEIADQLNETSGSGKTNN